MNELKQVLSVRWRRWLREPLLHFAVVGFALFIVDEVRHTGGDGARIAGDAGARIVITPQREARLARQYSLQFGVQPDAAMMKQLLERDIEEEMLFRRGLALGLDKDDEIVRRRVVQKMQFLLEDVSAPAEPQEAELAVYFAAHEARYVEPPHVTFSHVYFSADAGDAVARRRAEEALRHLEQGADAMSLGDAFPDLYHFAAFGAEQVQRLFGHGDFAAATFSAPPGSWTGPYRSNYGWHLLHVESRREARSPLLTDVRDRVRTDYLLEMQSRANRAAIGALAHEYTIVRTDL